MTIAIDISPLKSGHYLQHRVRGTGFYLENLKRSLLKYYSDNSYTFFTRGEKLSKGIDLVHYPYFEPFFLSLPLFNRYKTVVTVHDLTPFVFPKEFPSGLKGKIKWQIQKRALKNADVIITDSESSKKDIIKYTGIREVKIKVVYLAAGEEFKKLEIGPSALLRMKLEMKRKYGLPDRFLLYVGDVTWNKNLPRLVVAVKKANIPMVMVGGALINENTNLNNPWNKDLVEVRRLIKEDQRITTLGFIPKEDLILLYNMATVFAMPSIYEGFGLPILEAMSCGCPVVASRGGSLAEVVGEAGKYTDPYEIDSIAKGISEVFNSPSLQKELSQKGIIQSKKFTWRKTANETMGVYRSVVSNTKNFGKKK